MYAVNCLRYGMSSLEAGACRRQTCLLSATIAASSLLSLSLSLSPSLSLSSHTCTLCLDVFVCIRLRNMQILFARTYVRTYVHTYVQNDGRTDGRTHICPYTRTYT